MNLRDCLLASAEFYELSANVLRECHTIGPAHKDWTDEDDAKADYEEWMQFAAECRRHAGLQYTLVETVDLDQTIETSAEELQASAAAITAGE